MAANVGYQYDFTKILQGSDYEAGHSVATDASGNVFVTGVFYSTTDFDPGEGVDNHTSNGNGDAYLTKFNSDGSYAWTETFGGSGYDAGIFVTISPSDVISVVGKYATTVDFDPGGGINSHTSNGSSDVFITMYTESGSYTSTSVIGGSQEDYILDAKYDSSGNLYLAGAYSSTVDFNPGDGVDNHTATGLTSSFLTKINSDGSYGWTKTVDGYSLAYSVSIDPSDYVYVSGYFRLTPDFDPGPGTDNRTAAVADIYLSKFSTDGDYLWTKAMGGTTYDYGKVVTNDGYGNTYLVSRFALTVDFDPGAGVDNHTSNGIDDIAVTKFNSNGDYLWTKTFGGTGDEDVYSGYSDSAGDLFITGVFGGTVDFDPGDGIASRTETSSYEAETYILSLDINGGFRWVHTFDSDTSSDGFGLAYSSYDNSLYVTGDFVDTIDFDPFGAGAIVTTDASWSAWLLKLSLAGQNFTSTILSGPSEEQYQIRRNEDGGSTGGVVIPVKDSNIGNRKIVVILEPNTVSFNSFLFSQKVSTDNLPDSNAIRAGYLLGIPFKSKIAWQVGDLQQIYFKAYPPPYTNYSPAVIIPELQHKLSIISLSYTDSDLIPPGDRQHPFKPSSLKIAHSLDGLKWTIINNSVVDQNNKTVSIIGKVGGYYMIVSTSQ